MIFPGGLNFGELYERGEDACEADRLFTDALEAAGLPEREKDRLGNLHTSTYTAYEEQGFTNGFRLGMMLARELAGEAVVV